MAKETGGNKDLYRKKNRGLLLKFLATDQCSNRAELTRKMDLTKMAISNMVNELISSKIIKESTPEKNEGIGRNPIKLKLADSSPGVIGLLIFRDRCEAVLCDLSLKVLNRECVSFSKTDRDQLIETIYTVIDRVIETDRRVIGIGAASIGPVDIENGIILNPKFFYDIENVPVTALLRNRYKLPVCFGNDNQCGVLAEKLFGVGRDYHDILLVGIGEGVGCGIINDDRPAINNDLMIPEFGHLSIDYNGPECFCGSRGCIERYINSRNLKDELQRASGLNLEFSEYCELTGNEAVNQVFTSAMEKLAMALVSAVNILNPRLIIIGHDGVCLPDKYLKLLEDLINKYKFTGDAVYIDVKKPLFLKDSQLLGAACGIIEEVFGGKYLFDLAPNDFTTRESKI